MTLLFALTLTSILGRWEGTSICTKVEENRYCHDEQVRYDFVLSEKDKNVVTLHAEKLVNGKYEWMGDLDFTFDAAKQRWSSTFHTRRDNRDGVWSFEIQGSRLKGTCVLLPDTVVRNAEAKRDPSSK